MRRSGFALFVSLAALLGLVAGCGGSDETGDAGENTEPLRVGAIPDQDPEILQRRFDLVADHLAEELGVEVEYVPVTDYLGAVTGFSVGDLDLVWFGVIIVTVAELGLITPPVGMNLFVIQGVASDLRIQTVVKGVVPFLMADILRLAILITFPALVLWLPGLAGF